MPTILAILLSLRLMGVPAQIESMSVSAYSNANGAPPFAGLTASGYYTRPGYCACGPSYPFGTMFYIPGHGAVVCADRGSATTDGHIDIWMPTEAEAWAFERHELKVVVVRPY